MRIAAKREGIKPKLGHSSEIKALELHFPVVIFILHYKVRASDFSLRKDISKFSHLNSIWQKNRSLGAF